MSDVIFYDLSVFSIFLLVTLLIVVYSKQELHTLRGRLFQALIISNIVVLAVEVLSWLFDGEPGNTAYVLNMLFNTVLFYITLITPVIWAIYINYIIFEDTKQIKENLYLYTTPIVIMVLLGTINVFFPILFEISDANVYSRLSGIWIGIILSYLIYLSLLITVIKNRKQLTSNFLVGVMIFLFFPLIAAFIQIQNIGLLLIWPSVAVATIFSYLLFETTSSSIDFLTGIYTRSRAEYYIKTLLSKQKPFSVIMLDIDDFKEINDQYGHLTGDKLLVEIGKILKQVYSKNDIVARFGGDEFIIVSESVDSQQLEQIRATIYDRIKSSSNKYIQNVKYSMGMAYCTGANDCTMEELMVHADNDMYKDKARNKNYKRRKSDN